MNILELSQFPGLFAAGLRTLVRTHARQRSTVNQSCVSCRASYQDEGCGTMNSSLPGLTQCQDGHRCFYGSPCTENPYDKDSFYCDCDESSLDDAVSGLSCEHVATEYCTFGNEVSMISFCTNNGTCRELVGTEDAHLGCWCPESFEGDHCQFDRGSTLPGGTNTSTTDATSGAVNLSYAYITLPLILLTILAMR